MSGWRELEHVVAERRSVLLDRIERRLSELDELQAPTRQQRAEIEHLGRLREGHLAQRRLTDDEQ